MNTTDLLHKRAQLAVQAAANAINAKSHVEAALRNATHGRLDIAVIDDLNKCISAIERAVKHAEQCRLRLLRKANRQGVTP